MPNKKCFLDTSVLVNAAIKVGPDNTAAIAAISRYSECQIPAYALKEYKSGVLSYYFWLYRKFVETGSAAQTLDAVVRLGATLKKNMAATALRAYQELNQFFLRLPLENIASSPNQQEELDKLAARVMTLELKRRIILGWSNRAKYGKLVDNLACYSNEDLVYDAERLDINPNKCRIASGCSCAKLLERDLDTLQDILSGLANAPNKQETTRRKDVIRKISLRGSSGVSEKECRSIGDAYFAVRCPDDCDLLTTNRRDIDPLAAQTGKIVVSP